MIFTQFNIIHAHFVNQITHLKLFSDTRPIRHAAGMIDRELNAPPIVGITEDWKPQRVKIWVGQTDL